VGYIRYNFVTPAPVINSLEHLNRILEEKLIKDRNRIHYQKKKTIKELLEEEYDHLLALPENDYPVFKEESAKANNMVKSSSIRRKSMYRGDTIMDS